MCAYYSKLGLRALLHVSGTAVDLGHISINGHTRSHPLHFSGQPDKFDKLPRRAKPSLKLQEYYSNYENRG